MPHQVPSSLAVNTTAARWARKHPELSDRLERAKALVANVTPGRLPHVFFVEGSAERSYIVRINRETQSSTCTCPDSRKDNHCKHRLATALFVAAKEDARHEQKDA